MTFQRFLERCFLVVVCFMAGASLAKWLDPPPEPIPQHILEEAVPENVVGEYLGCWPTMRNHFARLNSRCAACNSTSDLNIHHIKAAHLHPETQCVWENLWPLCREHHKQFGHPHGWKDNNPNVIRDSLLERKRRGLPKFEINYPPPFPPKDQFGAANHKNQLTRRIMCLRAFGDLRNSRRSV